MRSTVMEDLELEVTRWHDGQVLSLEIVPGEDGCEVRLLVAIYADLEHAPNRHELFIRFRGVRELSTSFNGSELVVTYPDHIAFARPNVTDAAIDLGIYLTGGYVRILADDYVVEKR